MMPPPPSGLNTGNLPPSSCRGRRGSRGYLTSGNAAGLLMGAVAGVWEGDTDLDGIGAVGAVGKSTIGGTLALGVVSPRPPK